MADFAQFASLVVALGAAGADNTEKSFRRVASEANKVADGFQKVENAQKGTTTATKAGADATDRSTKSLRDQNKELTASSGRLKVLGRDINKYITLPFLAFTGASTKFALDLNEGLGNVQALIPDTGDRIYELRDAVVDLAGDTGKSFQDINSGLYRTISVFQDNADTVERLNTAIRAGIAGYSTTADAVQLLSAVTRAYGDTSASAVDRVADLAFETIRLGDTTMPALSAAMQVATDRADRLGVTQEELFTVMSTLTGITGDASMVATQFRSAMDSLLNPTAEFTALLERMGYESAGAAIEAEGLAGTLVAIANEAERTGKPLRDFITRKEGVTLVSRLAGQQLQDFTWKLEALTNSTGAANRSYENVTQGVAKWNFELNKAKMELQGAFAEIGDNLLPVLATLSGVLADVVAGFAALPQPIQAVIAVSLTLVSVWGVWAQIAGAIKGLELAGVFTGIAKSLSGVAVAGTTANVALGLTLGLAGALVGVAVALGAAWVANEKRKQEAIELTNEYMEEQKQLSSGIADEMSRQRSNRTGITALTEVLKEQASLPGFELRGEGSDALLERSGQFIDLEQLASDKEYAQGMLEELEAIYESFSQNVVNKADESLGALRSQERELRDTMSSALSNLRESSLGEDWLTVLLGGNEATSAFLESTVDEQFRTLQTKIRERWTTFRRNQAAEAFAGPQETVFGEEELELLGDYLEILGQVNQVVGAQEGLRSAQNPRSVTNLNNQLTDLEATIRVVKMGLDGTLRPSDKDESVKSWQEWFSDITGVIIKESTTGIQAAQAYRQALQDELNLEETISKITGVEFDRAGLLEKQFEGVVSDIRELFSIDPSKINDPFTWLDKLIAGTKQLPGLIRIAREVQEKWASQTVTDMVKAWQDEENQLRLLSEAYEDIGMSTEKYSLTVEDYQKRLEEAIEKQVAFRQKGLGPNSEAVQDNAEEIEKLILKMRELNALNALAAQSFDEVSSSIRSTNDIIKSGLFEGFMDIGYSQADRSIYEDLKQQSDDGKALTESQVEQLEKLSEGFTKAQYTAATLADILGNALMEVVDALTQVFVDMGKAIYESGNASQVLLDTVTNLWLKLVEAMPTMFMQAGLQAMMAGQWELGLALLALGGITGLVGGIYTARIDEERAGGGGTGGAEDLAQGAAPDPGLQNTVNRNLAAPDMAPRMVLTTGTGTTSSGSGGTNVTVNNYAGVDVEERVDNNGNIDLTLRRTLKNAIAGGVVDKEMRSRYGVRTM